MSPDDKLKSALRAWCGALGALLAFPLPVAGQEANPPPTVYHAARGSITEDGVYFAPAAFGVDTVIATTGSLVDTSLVRVITSPSAAAAAPPPAPSRPSPAPSRGAAAPSPTGPLWLDEDFSRYTSMEHLLSNPFGRLTNPANWPRWYHTKEMALDPNEHYGSSSQSLRYEWPVLRCKAEHAIMLEYKPPPQREFWAEVVAKFAPTFTTSETPCGGSAYKFVFFWRPTGDRFDLINGVNSTAWWAGNPETPGVRGGLDARGNPLCGDAGNRNCRVEALNNLNGDPPSVNRRWDGQWHVYRFHVALSSCPTCADGAYEIWTDNPRAGGTMVKVESRRNLVVAHSRTGAYSDRIERIDLGGNMNQGPLVPGVRVWWGRFRIWTSDPGW